ncbi:MAG: hypothetical protein ACOYMF_06070 [Bacteroidales bacterium]
MKNQTQVKQIDRIQEILSKSPLHYSAGAGALCFIKEMNEQRLAFKNTANRLNVWLEFTEPNNMVGAMEYGDNLIKGVKLRVVSLEQGGDMYNYHRAKEQRAFFFHYLKLELLLSFDDFERGWQEHVPSENGLFQCNTPMPGAGEDLTVCSNIGGL